MATALSVHCLACSCIAGFAEESVREEWLPEMATGRPVGAFALSEPEAGSNPAEMSTTARQVDEGGYSTARNSGSPTVSEAGSSSCSHRPTPG